MWDIDEQTCRDRTREEVKEYIFDDVMYNMNMDVINMNMNDPTKNRCLEGLIRSNKKSTNYSQFTDRFKISKNGYQLGNFNRMDMFNKGNKYDLINDALNNGYRYRRVGDSYKEIQTFKDKKYSTVDESDNTDKIYTNCIPPTRDDGKTHVDTLIDRRIVEYAKQKENAQKAWEKKEKEKAAQKTPQ